jgi:hypothetical protein
VKPDAVFRGQLSWRLGQGRECLTIWFSSLLCWTLAAPPRGGIDFSTHALKLRAASWVSRKLAIEHRLLPIRVGHCG